MKKLLVAVVCAIAGLTIVNANAETSKVKLETDLGVITIELFADEAPVTVENFLGYVRSGFYNGTIFHRVVPGFVVQGGGYTFDFVEKPTNDPIINEAENGLKNTTGTLSMARTRDPNSATSQFFINLKHNNTLDYTEDNPGYAVFGEVVDGMDVVEKIVEIPRGLYKKFPDAPNAMVRIIRAVEVK